MCVCKFSAFLFASPLNGVLRASVKLDIDEVIERMCVQCTFIKAAPKL